MTNAGELIDLLINKEPFWVSNEEKLDEKISPLLDSFVIADAVVVKDRSRLSISEISTEVLFGWLDTLGLNNVD